MEEPISFNLFVCSLAIYILGFVFFYVKQLYGLVKNWENDKSCYIRKMLYGIPIFVGIAIALIALLLIGCLIELGGIDEFIKYFS